MYHHEIPLRETLRVPEFLHPACVMCFDNFEKEKEGLVNRGICFKEVLMRAIALYLYHAENFLIYIIV